MLTKKNTRARETVEARQVRMSGDQAWELLQGADEIIVSQRQKVAVFHPASDAREDILAHCLGRTGSLRAPALKIGTRILVGFNDEMYRTFVK